VRVRYWQVLAGPAEALDALEALVYRARKQIRRGGVPPLFESGVRYRRERGANHWRTPKEVLAAGNGDCEDLAAWRVAELRESGADRKAYCMIRHGGRPGLWHILVRRGDGRVEDPSKVLGMKGRG